MALSGGRIARELFTAVTAQARPVSFAGVHFFWADERCVPPDNAESNYALAAQLLGLLARGRARHRGVAVGVGADLLRLLRALRAE